jgi:asparaginyl-tRNA synthetase
MVEPEVAFSDLDDNMDLAERFLKRIFKDALEQSAEDMALFNEHYDKTTIETLEKIVATDFRRLPYTEAVEILQKCGEKFEFPVSWGIDLQSEHERYLTEKHFQGPVILFDYPRTLKPF